MKRLIVAVCIIVALVVTNIYTNHLLKEISGQILQSIESMETGIDALSTQELERQGEELLKLWLDSERTMSRFVRHTELDSITSVMARLPSLARYDSRALLAADLEQARVLLLDLLAFESPSPADIL